MKLRARWVLFVSVVALLGGPGASAVSAQPPVSNPVSQTAASLLLDPEVESLHSAEQKLGDGQYLEALAILREVLKRDAHHLRALSLVATTLAEMGRHRDALRVLEQLVEQHPDDVTLLNNLAWVLATAGDTSLREPERAVDLARKALLLAPNSYSVWSTLAEAYYQIGLYDKALRAAAEALRLGQEQKADTSSLTTYVDQIKKSQAALEVFSLLD